VDIGATIADALEHAHSRGVIHRDVSSSNIMLTPADRAVLLDFGLALPATATRVTQPGAIVGTAAYVAPEVAQGGDGDERSDLYSLGAVLYECAHAVLPLQEYEQRLSFSRPYTAPWLPPQNIAQTFHPSSTGSLSAPYSAILWSVTRVRVNSPPTSEPSPPKI
jgi:serine/threonine protein kinase